MENDREIYRHKFKGYPIAVEWIEKIVENEGIVDSRLNASQLYWDFDAKKEFVRLGQTFVQGDTIHAYPGFVAVAAIPDPFGKKKIEEAQLLWKIDWHEADPEKALKTRSMFFSRLNKWKERALSSASLAPETIDLLKPNVQNMVQTEATLLAQLGEDDFLKLRAEYEEIYKVDLSNLEDFELED